MTLDELRRERDRLRERFDALGGRGIDLADEIDEVEAKIEVMENPPSEKEAMGVVLKVAQAYLDECGSPDDETIADTEALRIAYIEAAMERVRRSVMTTEEK